MTVSRISAAALVALGLVAGVGEAQETSIDVGEPINILPVPPEGGQTGGATFGTPTAPSDVETVVAAPIESESFGTLGDADGGLGGDVWMGSSRPLIEPLVGRLAAVPGSRALNDLAARLLATAATPPEGPPGTHWLALRLDRMVTLGRAIEAVPGTFGDATVAGAARLGRFHAMLARGDDMGACAEAQAAVQTDDAPLWPRAIVYCQLSGGRADAALLGLDVLQAGETPMPASFAPLVRALASGTEPVLDGFADATVVEAALARAAGVLPADAADPWVLSTLTRGQAPPDAARLAMAERAEALGVLSTDTLAQLYDAAVFDAALSDPVTEAERLDGPLARALLYQAARGPNPPQARAEIIAAALAETTGTDVGVAARVFGAMIAELPPDESLIWFAPTAVHALIAADRPAAALVWWRLAQGRDAVVAASMEPLWPLARLAELDAGEGGAERLALWWQRTVVEGDPAAEQRAALAAALLLALGDGAGTGILVEVAAVPAPAAAPVALLAGLDAAADAGRRGETVLLAALAGADGGPAGAAPEAVVAAVRALARIGFEDEARRLAIEAAIAHGL